MVEMICDNTLMARRGGIGRLIEGLFNGDPVAWWIVGGVVVFFAGSALFGYLRNNSEESEETADSDSSGEDEDA